MTAAELYSDKILIEAFGKSRVFEVCRHLRTLWPDFPKYDQKVNNYTLAWVVFILSKCKRTQQRDVEKAILEGKELECEGQPFISYFGDLLFSPDQIQSEINTVYIFYQGDNAVHVTYNTVMKIFQGNTRAANVMRAAMLRKEFLLELSEMLMPFEDESLQGPVINDEENEIN